MTQQDLKQIRDLVKELFDQGFTRAFSQVWEFNIESALTDMDKRISSLPTKQYLDEKIWSLRAEINPQLKRLDNKIGQLTGVLENKRVLTPGEANEINSI